MLNFQANPTLLRFLLILKAFASGKHFSTRLKLFDQVSLFARDESSIADRGETIRMSLDLGLMPEILSSGFFQPEVSKFLFDGISKNHKVLVFDLGAHEGIITRQTLMLISRENLAVLTPLFVCVEPNPKHYSNLKLNLARFENSVSLCLAVHPALPRINLTSDWLNSGNTTILSESIPKFRKRSTFESRALNLQDLISNFEGGIPIILKSDVEGLDIAILSSLNRHTWTRIERFVVECYGNLYDDMALIYEHLKNFDLFWPDLSHEIDLEDLMELSKNRFISSTDLFAIRKR
jgi:FkbM family methyltransferase